MKKTIRNIIETIRFSFAFSRKTDKYYIMLRFFRIVCEVINSVILVTIPRKVIDSLCYDNYNAALLYVLVLSIATLAYCIISGIFDNNLKIRNMRLNKALQLTLQQHLAEMPYEQFESCRNLDEFSMVEEFVSEVSVSAVIDKIFAFFTALFKIVSYTVIITEYSWIFLVIVLFAGVIKMVCQGREKKEVFKIQQFNAFSERRISYASKCVMDYSNAKEVRLFNLRSFIIDKFRTHMNMMYSNEFDSVRKVAPWKIISAFCEGLFVIAAYGCLGYALYCGDISVGVFVQDVSAFFALNVTLTAAADSTAELKNNFSYISAYKKFVGVPLPSTTTGCTATGCCDAPFNTIEFENVSFTYPESDTPVFKNLNLILHRGEKIAIVGKNGAGKTTLVKLLLGLYQPTSGRILIDGKPLSDMSDREYLEHFSVAFQNSTLLKYTFRENLSFESDTDLKRAGNILSLLGILDVILEKENGLDSFFTRTLDSKGSDLSGGEKRKLLIARTMYKKAEMYIFDEPTAELSALSELKIYDAIFSSTEIETLIFISHRLACCKKCSRIIVLDSGTVTGDGTHNELMKSHELYSDMFRAQASLYNEEESV